MHPLLSGVKCIPRDIMKDVFIIIQQTSKGFDNERVERECVECCDVFPKGVKL
jgi:hypothetical protein